MRPIPLKMRNEMDDNSYYHTCARKSAECRGRITWEHALLYAGKQINEPWAIVPLCFYHHLGEGLNKRVNEYIAINRATPKDLAKYPRVNWETLRRKLKNDVGEYI